MSFIKKPSDEQSAEKARDRKAEKRAGKKARRSDKPRRTPAKYIREVIVELKKTTWPTRPELRRYVVAVLVFVLIAIAIVFVFDFGLERLFRLLYDTAEEATDVAFLG